MSPTLFLIVGVVVLLLGGALIAGWFDWLLDVLGFILVIIGIVAIIAGIINLVGGRNSGSRGY
jgi:uncharacterized membrane protein